MPYLCPNSDNVVGQGPTGSDDPKVIASRDCVCGFGTQWSQASFTLARSQAHPGWHRDSACPPPGGRGGPHRHGPTLAAAQPGTALDAGRGHLLAHGPRWLLGAPSAGGGGAGPVGRGFLGLGARGDRVAGASGWGGRKRVAGTEATSEGAPGRVWGRERVIKGGQQGTECVWGLLCTSMYVCVEVTGGQK